MEEEKQTKTAKKKTKKKTAKKTESFSVASLSDRDRKILEKADMTAEERMEWLKKRNAEAKEAKKGNKILEVFYTLNGDKLNKKVRKANGGILSYYVGNIRKNPDIMTEEIKASLK